MASAMKKNGPAEVAASMPSRGSNNPRKGNAVNEQHDSTPEDRLATAEDYAAAEFTPFGQEIVTALPTNVQFSDRVMPIVRLGAVILTKTKAETIELFAENEDIVRELHDQLLETRDYLGSTADLCDQAALRILIAASAVDLAEQSGRAA